MSIELSGKIAAWNIKDGLDGPQALAIAEKIADQAPDIVFLSEASKHSSSEKSVKVLKLLREAVGPQVEIDYKDMDPRVDTHSFMGIARASYGAPDILRIGGRRGLYYRLTPDFSVLGYHGLDRKYHGDRTEHELQRVVQAQAAINAFPTPGKAAVIAGDLNTMHAVDPSAQLLRAAGWLSDLLPAGEPSEPQSKIARIGSLAQRLCAMASGDSLRVLEDAGFVDADPTHQGTKSLFGKFLNVQLDHILSRGDVVTSGFTVVPAEGLSDHDMIVAEFTTR